MCVLFYTTMHVIFSDTIFTYHVTVSSEKGYNAVADVSGNKPELFPTSKADQTPFAVDKKAALPLPYTRRVTDPTVPLSEASSRQTCNRTGPVDGNPACSEALSASTKRQEIHISEATFCSFKLVYNIV